MEELKAVVLANNPDVTPDQRSIIEQDLDQLAALIKSATQTQSIVSGMAEVVEIDDYAFMGQWRYNAERSSMASLDESNLLFEENKHDQKTVSTMSIQETT